MRPRRAFDSCASRSVGIKLESFHQEPELCHRWDEMDDDLVWEPRWGTTSPRILRSPRSSIARVEVMGWFLEFLIVVG